MAKSSPSAAPKPTASMPPRAVSSGPHSSPIAWCTQGKTLAICNGRAELQAVDLHTGEIAWSVPGAGESTPALVGDLLVVQTRKPELGLVAYQLSAAGAQKLWNYPMDPL